ncbi:MAG: polyprenol monophosphomannose synthase [Candidatus Omnitrophota bacterium]|jgi:dolichol-phosphate mannosyltransferase
MTKIVVVVPTYNESGNISSLLDSLLALPFDKDILIIDDNSPDGTAKIVTHFMQDFKNVHLISRSRKLGLGSAYIEGFRFAIKNGFEHCLTMDADFSHDPKFIPDLLAKKYEFDIVIGSRYVKGGVIKNWGLRRKLTSFIANTLARLILGVKCQDFTGAFRLYSVRIFITHPGILNINSDGYSSLLELLYKCSKKGCTVGEAPIVFSDRRAGVSKISRKEILKAIHTIMSIGAERYFGKNG